MGSCDLVIYCRITAPVAVVWDTAIGFTVCGFGRGEWNRPYDLAAADSASHWDPAFAGYPMGRIRRAQLYAHSISLFCFSERYVVRLRVHLLQAVDPRPRQLPHDPDRSL